MSHAFRHSIKTAAMRVMVNQRTARRAAVSFR